MESLSALNDPFLAKRDAAEEAWDHRFKDAEVDCPAGCNRGWIWYENDDDWVKCDECQGGSIYTALCVRCQKDDNHCECSIGDFL